MQRPCKPERAKKGRRKEEWKEKTREKESADRLFEQSRPLSERLDTTAATF